MSRGKRRKCWLPAFFPFPTMFLKGLFFWVVKFRDCAVEDYWVENTVGKGEKAGYQKSLCGKGLTLYQRTIFWTVLNSKHLKMTNSILLKL